MGWADRLIYGHVHANYGNLVPWGLWIAIYVSYSGCSAGAFLISSLVLVFGAKEYEKVARIALFTAMVTLIMAMLAVVADLGHLPRVWHVIVYSNFRSPMAWMIWLFSAFFAMVSLELWILLRRDLILGSKEPGFKGLIKHFLTFGSTDVSPESQVRDSRIAKKLATFAIPVAIMFPSGVGSLFGIVAARPHWHSGLFPILFMLSAIVGGGALLVIVSSIFKHGIHRNGATIVALGSCCSHFWA